MPQQSLLRVGQLNVPAAHHNAGRLQIAIEFPLVRIALQLAFNVFLRKNGALPARILRKLSSYMR